MKTPFFWYQPHGLLSTLLWSLGWVYGKGGKIMRTLKKQERFFRAIWMYSCVFKKCSQ